MAGVFFEIGIEDAMDDEVGVAADRRGEVGVVIFRQTVVAVGRGAVGGLFQTAQELGAQRVALGVRREDDEQFDDFGAHAEVADGNVERVEQAAKLLEFFGIGFVVNAVE